jgi:hypothetical protein
MKEDLGTELDTASRTLGSTVDSMRNPGATGFPVTDQIQARVSTVDSRIVSTTR